MKKKKVFYVIIGFEFLLMVIYLVRYHLPSDASNKIPANASAVVYVDIRQIEHQLLFDYILNPFSGRTEKSASIFSDSLAKKIQPYISLMRSISVPRNLWLYQTGNNKTAWFTAELEIDDPQEFTESLTAMHFDQKQFGLSPEFIQIFRKEPFLLVQKNNRLIVGWSNDQLPSDSMVQTLFNQKKFLKESDPLLEQIVRNQPEYGYNSIHGTYIDGRSEQGNLVFSGKISEQFDLFSAAGPLTKIGQNKPGIANVSARFNTQSSLLHAWTEQFNQSNIARMITFSVDSAIQKWDGSIAFDLQSVTSITDTIISYEYDEDFNKTAKKNTRKKQLPDVNLYVGSNAKDTNNLYNYLIGEYAIRPMENDTIFIAFPVYKLITTGNSEQIRMHTVEQRPIEKTTENLKLEAWLNLELYAQTPLAYFDLPINSSSGTGVKSIHLVLSDSNNFTVQIAASNVNRSFVAQMIR